MTAARSLRIVSIDLGDHDDLPLCVILDRGHRGLFAATNARYPEAEAHVRAHVARCFGTLLICAPDCDGTPH